MVDITCPHCGFSKKIDANRFPGRSVRVTCPKCRQYFSLPDVAAAGRAALPAASSEGKKEKSAGPAPPGASPVAGEEPDDAMGGGPSTEIPEDSPRPSAVFRPPAPEPPPESSLAEEEKRIATAPDGETAAMASEEVTVTCPHCGYQRRVKKEILPEPPSRVSCRACRQLFPISLDLAGAGPEQSPLVDSAQSGGSQGPQSAAAGLADAPQSEEPPAPPPDRKLPGVKELFGRSWGMFKIRIWTFLGILLLGGLLSLIPATLIGKVQEALAGLGSNWVLAGFSLTAALVLTLLVFAWIGAAMFYAAVDEELGVRPCLGLALQRLWAWMWLFGLLGFVIAGAFMLFLVPGILFSIWFFFAYYVLAGEDVKGMEALLKSREYVRGYAWPVFFRLLVLWLLTSFLSIVLLFIPLLGQLVSLLLIPFTLIYQGQLFHDLRQVKGDIRYDCSRREKGKWLGMAAAGWVIPPVIVFFLLLPQWGELQRRLPLPGDQVAGSLQYGDPAPGPELRME